MRVIYDGRSLLNAWTGIQMYLLELLSELESNNPSVERSLFLPGRRKVPAAHKEMFQRSVKAELVYKPIAKSVIDRLARRTTRFLDIKGDIFHETDIFRIPTDKPSVLTVHDVIPTMFPYYYPPGGVEYFVDVTKYNLQVASRVIADSEATKRALSFFFNYPLERIQVVYAGVSGEYRPVAGTEQMAHVRRKYNLPDKYLLFLGTIEPRKNVKLLLQAFHRIAKQADPTKLVICGRYGWLAEDVYKVYDKLKLEGKVIFLGYVEDEDKPYLYSGARGFVYPSLYEGFGLPPLEAMACGVPVITSDISSLPEVVGDAGILVDPENEEELAEQMLRIANDDELNASLSAKGLQRAKKFTWANTAESVLAVYNELLG